MNPGSRVPPQALYRTGLDSGSFGPLAIPPELFFLNWPLESVRCALEAEHLEQVKSVVLLPVPMPVRISCDPLFRLGVSSPEATGSDILSRHKIRKSSFYVSL